LPVRDRARSAAARTQKNPLPVMRKQVLSL
jgi:hypothetical protein